MESYERQGTLFLLGMLSICGLLIALALVSFVVIHRRIWTPVGALQRQTQMVAADMDRLAEVTNKIAAGELDRAFVVDTQPLRPVSPDEIGSLMRKHDEMIAHLQKTGNAIATLTATQKRAQESLRRVRDQLEARVLQRTADLTRINAELRAEVAERKRAEQSLRLMIETIPEMIWSATPDGMVDYCNQRILDYTGLPFDLMCGEGWAKAIHPDDLGAMAELWRFSSSKGLTA